MLPRRHRLRSSLEFSHVVRTRRRAGSRTLVVHADLCPQSGEQSVDDARVGARSAPRVGLIVSKAVGGSVERSSVKRRLRHAVVPLLGDLPAGSLVVIRANPAAATAGFGELQDDLRRCLRRVVGDSPARVARGGA